MHIEVGFKAGVADTVGNTAAQAIKRLLGIDTNVYTSTRFLFKDEISIEKGKHIVRNVLANEIIQKWSITKSDSFSEAVYLPIGKIVLGWKSSPTIPTLMPA